MIEFTRLIQKCFPDSNCLHRKYSPLLRNSRKFNLVELNVGIEYYNFISSFDDVIGLQDACVRARVRLNAHCTSVNSVLAINKKSVWWSVIPSLDLTNIYSYFEFLFLDDFFEKMKS